jgi:hypothetical protein
VPLEFHTAEESSESFAGEVCLAPESKQKERRGKQKKGKKKIKSSWEKSISLSL